MRIIFMGTPAFSVPTLNALVGAGHEVVAAYSQPPRKSGRGMKETPSPVHQAAQDHAIEVFTPTSLKGEDVQAHFASHNADVAIVVAYGLLLPQAILDMPRHGCLNLHASLLPRWRGAAPINRAIMAGDKQSGIMVMQMEKGLDTGSVARSLTTPIQAEMTAGDLHDELMQSGAGLMLDALEALKEGALNFTAQSEEGVTYAQKIDKAEARINWEKTSDEVVNQINGLSPFPGAWCEYEEKGKKVRLKILRAKPISISNNHNAGETIIGKGLTIACGAGAVECLQVQKAGKGAVYAADFLRGQPDGSAPLSFK